MGKSTIHKIDQFLLERYEEKYYQGKPRHKPSSVGSKCLRKIYYGYYQFPEDNPPDARLLKIFDVGNYFEDILLSYLMGIGEHIPYRNKGNGKIPKQFGDPTKENRQFPIKSPRWRIKKGFIDNVAIVNGEIWLYEIKSIKNDKYKKLKGQPLSDHLIQGSIYVQCFNDLLNAGEYSHVPELSGREGQKAKGIKYLYFNKDSQELAEFVILTKELTQVILDIDNKIMTLNEKYIDPKLLPPKKNDYCPWCSWKDQCAASANYVDDILTDLETKK